MRFPHFANDKFFHFLGLFSFFLVMILALRAAVYAPFHNWGVIGYISSAKSFELYDIKDIHDFTYKTIKNNLPKEKYEALVTGNYGAVISQDSRAFSEQLPFYQIRPVYNFLIFILHKVGVDIIFATHIISGVSVVLGLFALYFMGYRRLWPPLIPAVSVISIIFGVVELARFSTPDGLAFMLSHPQ